MRGSVFKRCSRCAGRVSGRVCPRCETRDHINWGYVVELGTAPSGKRKQRLRSGYGTRREAEEQLNEALRDLDDSGPLDLTLSEYFYGHWLSATQPPHVRWKTWNDRKQQLENHVLPRLGEVQLSDLKPTHLNLLYADLLADGRIGAEGGLAPASVHGIHRIIRKALNDAVAWGLLVANPAANANPPRLAAVRAARRRKMQTWTASQVQSFLNQTSGDELHALWYVALATGMRRSELLGLKWTDVHLEKRFVTVRHTVIEAEDGYELVGDQKSLTSGRTIYLDRRTCDLLRAHRKHQDRQRDDAGTAWQASGVVFADPLGRPYHPDRITKGFHRAVQDVDVPRIRPHDMRHTHATLLLQAGVNPKVVSERLGHSSVAFTLDTYAHVMPGMQPEAAERLAELIFGTDEDDASATNSGQEEEDR